ncbi:unnamed protein product [Didymodactylos carnosus]|uniref:VPS10 domain-containing protein n=1 Tax=Didymodactylos carnosus TaxID=1234261 RepID=A0A814LWA0_9BILA|nr:unnamed protein product [Didymodactylos carnosus]CAF3837640.1 unnamed protein product [Didymodactylos carnosus]
MTIYFVQTEENTTAILNKFEQSTDYPTEHVSEKHEDKLLPIVQHFNNYTKMAVSIAQNIYVFDNQEEQFFQKFDSSYIIPVFGQPFKKIDNLMIYNDVAGALSIFDQSKNILEYNISFKPSNIYVSPYVENVWIASDVSSEAFTLYISENGGGEWKKLEDGTKFLAWSTNNSIYISKLHQMQRIDISTLEQIQNPVYEHLASSNFLTKYFIGTDINFHCATEDIRTNDLILFLKSSINDTTCMLYELNKRKPLLTHIICHETSKIICSENELSFFYQVKGLQGVYITNVHNENHKQRSTVITFDHGSSWLNITFVNNLCNSGSKETHSYDIADGGLLMSTANKDFIFYSTDYGLNWNEKHYPNGPARWFKSVDNGITSFFTISGYELEDNSTITLSRLDFNHVINRTCLLSDYKEWTPRHARCLNGLRTFYKRRSDQAICSETDGRQFLQIRYEPCSCELEDFQCDKSFKRTRDSLCVFKPRSDISPPSAQHSNCQLASTWIRRRGYTKLSDNLCERGVMDHLHDVELPCRDLTEPKYLIYGLDANDKPVIRLYYEFDEEWEDEEDTSKLWHIDTNGNITAITYNDRTNYAYIAVEVEQKSLVYSVMKDFSPKVLQQHILLESNPALYSGSDEIIEYLSIDWITNNLYLLIRNKSTNLLYIKLLNNLTLKERIISSNIETNIFIIIADPVKHYLYWIKFNNETGVSSLIISDLSGTIQKEIYLLNSTISFLTYDVYTHDLFYVTNSSVYAYNTLLLDKTSPRFIYTIPQQDTVAKILLFNNDLIYAEESQPVTHSNECAKSPCSELCIPFEHNQFECICGKESSTSKSCICPSDEQTFNGVCRTINGKCAHGRQLCQDGVHCARNAFICEEKFTQYTEEFKNSSQCTINSLNDGFDCYYEKKCIPKQWFCDGQKDCQYGNDEDHCHKITTTRISTTTTTAIKRFTTINKKSTKCATDQRYVLCGVSCIKVDILCVNSSTQSTCNETFQMNCVQKSNDSQFVCKCTDQQGQCLLMKERCTNFTNCQEICKKLVLLQEKADSKVTNNSSSTTWILLLIGIIALAVIAIIVLSLNYHRRNKKKSQGLKNHSNSPSSQTDGEHPKADMRLLSNPMDSDA